MTRKKNKRKPQKKAQSSALSAALTTVRPDGTKMIEKAQLERIPNPYPKRKYTIDFTCPEFTCICPRSGFPDFATIYIQYTPYKWIVELKSLKLYINKFRNQGIFHEAAINQILDDFVKLLDPRECHITGDFNVRGNIKTVIKASHHRSR